MHAKCTHVHVQLGGSGGMPPRIFCDICCSEIESGGFGHLQYPNTCVHIRFSCNN